jgi:site-specific DNA recombinase
LDQIVWTEVIRLLEDPALIQHELDRRLAAARAADPTRQCEQTVQRELVRVGKSIERVLTAYQEELLSLEQLRERMPSLRRREQALRTAGVRPRRARPPPRAVRAAGDRPGSGTASTRPRRAR